MLRIQAEALTYDDVSLVPAHSTVLPKDVSLSTRFTRDLRINLPIVSAAMDTVTEARLAVAMAQLGGIGILHKNMTAEQQAAEVAKVKKFESGVIRDPITVKPETTIREVLALTRARAERGAALYEQQCSACHGLNREGAPPDFPALTDIGKRMQRPAIEAVIRGGKGRMPGFPQIAGDDLDALIGHLRDPAPDKIEAGGSAYETYRFTGYRKFLDDVSPDQFAVEEDDGEAEAR